MSETTPIVTPSVPRPSRTLGLIGLALAVLSPLTCGVLAIPGIIVCGIALVRQRRSRLAQIGLLVSVLSVCGSLGLLAFVDPSQLPLPQFVRIPLVRLDFKIMGLPSLPGDADAVDLATVGNGFTRAVWVRFHTSPTNARAFLTTFQRPTGASWEEFSFPGPGARTPSWFDPPGINDSRWLNRLDRRSGENDVLIWGIYDTQRRVLFVSWFHG